MTFGLVSVSAGGPRSVLAVFTDPVGPSGLTPSSYTLVDAALAPVSIVRVEADADPSRVWLRTGALTFATYTLSAPGVASSVGDPIDPGQDEMSFSGWSETPLFSARAVSVSAVDVLFSQAMLVNGALASVGSYSLSDLSGTALTVTSAVPNLPSGALRVRLSLSTPLDPSKFYALRLGSNLTTSDGLALVPGSTTFTWIPRARKASVPLNRFTGEVRRKDVPERSGAESLALQEGVTVLVETVSGSRSTDPQTTFTSETEALDRTFISIQNAGQEIFFEGARSLREDLLVRSVPFDAERPNASPSESILLTEAVGVDVLPPLTPPGPTEGSVTLQVVSPTGTEEIVETMFFGEQITILPTSAAHVVSVAESLSGPVFVESNRGRLALVGAENLTVQEALTVLPDSSPGLADSTRDLFGTPNGQVFFSPSLVPGGGAGSTLQVDDVAACTKAYDTYSFPPTADPNVFMTAGLGLVPVPGSLLNGPDVLVTGFYRLREAQFNLSLHPSDTLPPMVDVGATITLTQTYDPARFSLLNNPAWHLADGTGLPFVVADNLSPLGPPVVAPKRHFVNPGEVVGLAEALVTEAEQEASVVEGVTLMESFGLSPGFVQHVVSPVETLTLGEGISAT